MNKFKILIVGNPNSGKSSLFNKLTYSNSISGNWSGVTVGHKSSTIKLDDSEYEIIDLPGIHSLEVTTKTTDEEKISKEFILKSNYDFIIQVVDANALERSLILSLELKELGKRFITVLSKTDVINKRGYSVDLDNLESHIESKCIIANPRNGNGVSEIIHELKKLVTADRKNANTLDFQISKVAERYESLSKIYNKVLIKRSTISTNISNKIDLFVVNQFLSIPIFCIIMLSVFSFSINFAGIFQDLIESITQILFVDLPKLILTNLNTPTYIAKLLPEAFGGGISVVLTFSPIIFALYCMLGLLSDSGYIARASFIMDGFLNKLGLNGKAFIPLIIGFGCNIPSIISTRILDSKNEKIMIAMMAPFMSCGARLSVYALFCAAFFKESSGLIVFSLYMLGILVAILTGFIAKFLLGQKASEPMIIDLPNYNLPNLRLIFNYALSKTSDFIFNAGKTICIVFAVLTILNSVTPQLKTANNDNSIIAETSKLFTPLFSPIGIEEENWPAVVGIISGVFAKEIVVGTLGALYIDNNINHDEAYNFSFLYNKFKSALSEFFNSFSAPLSTDFLSLSEINFSNETEIEEHGISIIQSKFKNQANAYAYLIFILLYFPCISVYAAIKTEIGNKYAVISAIWSTSIAYIISALFLLIFGN